MLFNSSPEVLCISSCLNKLCVCAFCWLNFRDNGVEVAVHARKFFNEDHLEWANLVIAAGGKQSLVTMATALRINADIPCSLFFDCAGDGNFLATASKIRSPEKILIGINTDPHRLI